EVGSALLADRGQRLGVVFGLERDELESGGRVEREVEGVTHQLVDSQLGVAHRQRGAGRQPGRERHGNAVELGIGHYGVDQADALTAATTGSSTSSRSLIS